jgi:hypothetical protein
MSDGSQTLPEVHRWNMLVDFTDFVRQMQTYCVLKVHVISSTSQCCYLQDGWCNLRLTEICCEPLSGSIAGRSALENKEQS